MTELSAAIRRWLGAQTFAVADDPRRRPDPRCAGGALRGPGRRADHGAGGRRVAGAAAPQRVLPAVADRAARTVATGTRRRQRGARSRAVGARGVSRSGRPGASCARALSTFSLESESVVEPSSFIEDCRRLGCATETGACRRTMRASSATKCLRDDPAATGSRWARVRAANADARSRAVRGRGRRRGCCRASASAGSSAT